MKDNHENKSEERICKLLNEDLDSLNQKEIDIILSLVENIFSYKKIMKINSKMASFDEILSRDDMIDE